MFDQLKRFVWENKEGAIVGGVLGYFFISPLLTKDASSVQSLQAAGIVDVVKSAGTSVAEFAVQKAHWLGVAVGAVIGAFVDAVVPEGFLQRWFK